MAESGWRPGSRVEIAPGKSEATEVPPTGLGRGSSSSWEAFLPPRPIHHAALLPESEASDAYDVQVLGPDSEIRSTTPSRTAQRIDFTCFPGLQNEGVPSLFQTPDSNRPVKDNSTLGLLFNLAMLCFPHL